MRNGRTQRWTIPILLGLLLVLLVVNPYAYADIIEVDQNDPGCVLGAGQPDPYFITYCKVQDAVTDAASGDWISIDPGTYVENIGVGTNITLSGSDRETTILSGGGAGTVVNIYGGATVTISGVTIRDGYAVDGGGVIAQGSLTLSDCKVIDNDADSNGGGIYIPTPSASATIQDCLVQGNSAGSAGGGIYNDGTLELIDSQVLGNTLTGLVVDGGGIYNDNGATATISYSLIDGNVLLNPTDGGYGAGIHNGGTMDISYSEIANNTANADSDGGGINNNASLTIDHSTIHSNVTYGSNGGGIHHGCCELEITNSTIRDNQAIGSGSSGGGIHIVYITSISPGLLENVTISGNSAGDQGGGIRSQDKIDLINVTVSGNTAVYGGGIFHALSEFMNLKNCTVMDNNISSGPYAGGVYALGPVSLVNTIMAGNDNANCQEAGSGSIGSLGYNIEDADTCGLLSTGDQVSTDPRLGVLQDYNGPIHTHALLAGSPAIDAGYSPSCASQDARGVSRPKDGDGNGSFVCDVGAYEYIARTRSPVDFDHDGRSEIVVFRAGAWRFFDYDSASFDHGVWTGTAPGCIPAPMDYNGDGFYEFTQLCDGAWHFYNHDGSYRKGIWTGGVAGDLPVPADYDGDDVDEVVVWRAGAWRFFDFESGAFDHGVWTGSPPHWLGGTSIPAPMDYDGDGAAEFTVWSGGPWHFYNDDGTYNKGIWTGGVAGDLPVPGDYEEDEAEEVVVWRNGAWRFFDFATASFDRGVWTGAPPHWLGGTPLPAPLDFDGDWRVDFSVWSGGPWHFYSDTGTYYQGIWTGGLAGDLPISRRLLP